MTAATRTRAFTDPSGARTCQHPPLLPIRPVTSRMVSVRRHRWWLAGLATALALAVQVGAAVLGWQHTRPRLPRHEAAEATARLVRHATDPRRGKKTSRKRRRA
jgi:hypothetical protein